MIAAHAAMARIKKNLFIMSVLFSRFDVCASGISDDVEKPALVQVHFASHKLGQIIREYAFLIVFHGISLRKQEGFRGPSVGIVYVREVEFRVEPVIPAGTEYHPAAVRTPCVETVHTIGVDGIHRCGLSGG